MDPIEVVDELLSKWIMHTLEPNNYNIQKFLKYKLRNYQSHQGGMWSPNLELCVQKDYKRTHESTFWNQLGKARIGLGKNGEGTTI